MFDISIRKTIFKENEVNWLELEMVGITKERLKTSDDLIKLLNGYKTSLINTGQIVISNIPINDFSAKYHLMRNEETGKVEAQVTLPSSSLVIPGEMYDYKFTENDKLELQTCQMLSHTVSLKPTSDGNRTKMTAVKDNTPGSMRHYIGIDPETNRVEWLAAYLIRIPNKIMGKELSGEEKKILLDGKPVIVNGLTKGDGVYFSAVLQVHAGKGTLNIKEQSVS